MSRLSFRAMVVRYLPLLAGLIGLAMFVTVVPSSPPDTVAATDIDDLLDGGGRSPFGASGGGAGTTGEGGTSPGGSSVTGGSAGGRGGGAGTTGTGGGGGSGSPAGGAATPGAWPQGEDCSRREVVESPACRPVPAWTGDNGGSTMLNLTAEEIRVVVYVPRRNEQVEAILAAGGGANSAQVADVVEAYEIYFNRAFETYGRHVKMIFQLGPGMANDPAAQQADATLVAEELRASFVLAGAASEAFHDELARRGVPSFTLTLQFPPEYYRDRAPYVWGTFPDIDLTLDHVAEYFCKRVHGRNAVHAGDPLMQQTPRKLGIVYPDDVSDAGPRLKAKIEACGGEVGHMVGYASDITTATQQASSIVAQLHSEGVTTVTCTCDPIAPIFFTNAASSQGWLPEWMHNGVFLTDHQSFGRLYNQDQWGRSFGVSVLSYYTPLADASGYRAYFAGKPDGDSDAAARASGGIYSLTLYTFSAIEAAGPDLNPITFAQAMFGLPVVGGTGNENRLSFGRNGPSEFTGIDNLMEIWWDPSRTGPDGDPGWQYYVAGGHRYNLGEWPRNDPVVFTNDGSPQPGRDPNA